MFFFIKIFSVFSKEQIRSICSLFKSELLWLIPKNIENNTSTFFSDFKRLKNMLIVSFKKGLGGIPNWVKILIPTILYFCNEVINEKEKDLKRNSFRTYLGLYHSRIEPYFKDKLVSEFKPIDVYNWFNTFKDSSTLNTCYTIVKTAFEKAIINGYIASTPFIIKRPKLKSKYQINPFTYDEANQIINHAPVNLKNLVAVAFYTGMRTGEVLGLKWSKVNFDNFTITIDNQIALGKEDTPKTFSSIRTIDMIPQCEYYLKQQFKITGSFEYVFLNSFNKDWTFWFSAKVKAFGSPPGKTIMSKSSLEIFSIFSSEMIFIPWAPVISKASTPAIVTLIFARLQISIIEIASISSNPFDIGIIIFGIDCSL